MANKFLLFGIIAIIVLALIASFKYIMIPLAVLIVGYIIWTKFFTKHEEEDI